MHSRKHLALGIITLLALVTVAVAYVRRQRIPSLILSSTSRASSEQPMPGDNRPAAPELASGTWINSDPLTLKGLRGRVVLVDFWTFAWLLHLLFVFALGVFHTRYDWSGPDRIV